MGIYGPDYWLLSLVKVDRGMVPTGMRNDEYILGKHIPYYAGLVIQHRRTGRRYFLDTFNSEVLLGDFLGYTRIGLPIPTLSEMVQTNQFIMLHNNINLVIVRDLDTFIKTNGLIQKQRDAGKMHEIARSIKTCDF